MLKTLYSPRYRIGIVLGLLIVLIFGAWLYFSRPSGIDGSPSIVSVTALHSDVFVKEAGTDFVPVPGQAKTTSGSTIRTSDTGRALLESLSTHRTLIDYSSEIVLTENGNQTHVELLAGAVWSRLAKVFDSGEYYEIKSPNAVGAVRGTSFGMWYADGVTTLIVTEGSVAFFAVDPETGLPIPDTEVIVNAGQKAVCDRNGKINVTDLTQSDYSLPWVAFNASEDSPGAQPAPSLPGVPDSEAPVPNTPLEPSTTTPVDNGPEISVVSPSNIDEGSNERITIKGNGFEGVTTVLVGAKKVTFEILSDDTITIWADDVNPGSYDVTVIGAGDRSATRSRALTVNEVIPEEPSPQDPSQEYKP